MSDEELRDRTRRGIKKHGADEAPRRLQIATETALRFAIGERVQRGTSVLIQKNIGELEIDDPS